MRISILVLALAFIAGNPANSQLINVPAAVKSAFSAKYPNATDVKWGKENKHEYEAEFKMNNNAVSANFKENGSWVETESVITQTELPAAVKDAVMKKYPGATIVLSEKTEMPGNKIHYEVSFNVNQKKRSLEFNADGSPAK
ncbi:MAG: PepSY-like domain-containing protein [Chitinophagaceae bacterium]|nr:PepSY-like domain-containing protein [Chitinophagaceae bacterium]